MANNPRRFRARLPSVLAASACCLRLFAAGNAAAQGSKATCRVEVFEGEIHAGKLFEHSIGNGLKLMLEPLPSGWILRVLPETGPRGSHDYAELATPPYRSVSPLLISTDFSFRAQDALAWNPRRFHFAAQRSAFDELQGLFGEYETAAVNSQAQRTAEGRLAQRAAASPAGELTLLDAHLVQGSANQAQTAALVASHLNLSAHEADQPSDGRPTPLGRLNWIRFRVQLALPPGFEAVPGVSVQRVPCLNVSGS